MQVCTRAEAWVHQTFALQSAERFTISLIPIVLKIRTVIPGEAQQLEISLHSADIFRFRAVTIQILDTQNDRPALGLGNQPSRKSSVNIPGMHPTCRRWSEPPHHGTVRFRFEIM